MPKKRHKPEQIVTKLRQVDVLTSQGASVAAVEERVSTDIIELNSCGFLQITKLDNFKNDIFIYEKPILTVNNKTTKEWGGRYNYLDLEYIKKIIKSSCKSKVSSNPQKDWVIVGAFAFKNKKI